MKRLYVLLLGFLLFTGCGMSEASGPQSPEPPQSSKPLPKVISTLAVCGDAMSHMPLTRDAYDSKTGVYDYKPMLRYVKPHIQQADYAVVNLETTFAGGPDYSGYPTFNTPDALGEALADAGFDLVSTANNHCMDNRYTGLARTLDVLDAQGLAHVGTYRSADARNQNDRGVYLADVGGIRVAFLSYTYGTNGIPVSKSHPGTVNIFYTDYMDDAQTLALNLMARDLEAAQALEPDLIAVMMHWGTEYQTTPNDAQRAAADYLFERGADIILGSHPHVLQPIETRVHKKQDGSTRTGLIVWSLGNFISSQNDRYTDTTVLLNLELTKDPNTGITEVTGINTVPLYMYDREKEVNGERFTLLDARRSLNEVEQSNMTSQPLYTKLKQCIADCDTLLQIPSIPA